MFKVSSKAYKDMIKIHYATKTPLFVYGGPGIGKSAIPRQVAAEIAKEKNREFCEWVELTPEQQANVSADPSKFFVFVDFRLGTCDSSDLRGLPVLGGNHDSVKYAPQAWILPLSNPKADGMIFFDELNLAAPITAGQAYQIINEKVVSDIKLADNVFIFGAGNRAIDKAQVFSMSFPLKDRFSEIELGVNDDEFCEWAMENGINSHLISFIKWKPSYLYNPPKGTEDKGSTPRGIARASKLINHVKDVELDSPIIYNLVSASLGEAFATEFQAYCTCAASIDFEELIKNPKHVKTLTSQDKRFAICGLLGEHIRKADTSDKARLSAMFEICHNMPNEFGVVSLNMMRTSLPSNAVFKRMLQYYPKFKDLIATCAKYAL